MEEKFITKNDLRVLFFGLVSILNQPKISKTCMKNQLFNRIQKFSDDFELI